MDLISLAAAKKYADKLAAGFKSVRIDGMKLIFTLLDDTETTIILPAPSDGKDGVSVTGLSIDKDGSLLCYMSDGNIIDAGHVPAADVKLEDYYTKEEMDVKLESAGSKTFVWDGLSSEENENNLALFDEIYADFIATEGKTRLLVQTPNAQNPTYMNAELQYEKWGGDTYLNISTYPSWWSVTGGNKEEITFYSSYAYVEIINGKCTEVSELNDYEQEIHFLSTSTEYRDGYYYTPISDGSPVSKGYLMETLENAQSTYGFADVDYVDEKISKLIKEPVCVIDKNERPEITLVKVETMPGTEYGFSLNDDGYYASDNTGIDSSYAHSKFVINNPSDKTVRVEVNYRTSSEKGCDYGALSILDAAMADNDWDFYDNVLKEFSEENNTWSYVTYDVPTGEHFFTAKYVKDMGYEEGEDSFWVALGDTVGVLTESKVATEQYVSDAIDNISIPTPELTDYYTKEEIDDLLIESGSDLSISWNNIQDKPFESESLEKEMFNETLTFNSYPGNNRNYYVAEGEYLDGMFDGSSCSVYFDDIKRSGIVSEIEPWRNEDYCAVIGNPSITDEIIYT